MEKSALDMIFEQAQKNKEHRVQQKRERCGLRSDNTERPAPQPNERLRERRQEQREAIAKLMLKYGLPAKS
jgi:hypothetical protein